MRHLDLVVHAADKESWCSCRVSSGKACTRAWPQDGDAFVEELPCRPAQAKNFQLALRQKPQHVICQWLGGKKPKAQASGQSCDQGASVTERLRYGKLGPTNFGLDFRYPMSALAEFPTVLWKASSASLARTWLRRDTGLRCSHVDVVLVPRPLVTVLDTLLPCTCIRDTQDVSSNATMASRRPLEKLKQNLMIAIMMIYLSRF